MDTTLLILILFGKIPFFMLSLNRWLGGWTRLSLRTFKMLLLNRSWQISCADLFASTILSLEPDLSILRRKILSTYLYWYQNTLISHRVIWIHADLQFEIIFDHFLLQLVDWANCQLLAFSWLPLTWITPACLYPLYALYPRIGLLFLNYSLSSIHHFRDSFGFKHLFSHKIITWRKSYFIKHNIFYLKL